MSQKNESLQSVEANYLPDIPRTASIEQHKRNIALTKQQMEQTILSKFHDLNQVILMNALPHEVLFLRMFNDEGSFIYEKRITDPIEIQYIKENKDRKLWRTDYNAGSPDLAERLITRVIGAPKTTSEVNVTQDTINPEAKKRANDALDAFLKSSSQANQ